MNSIFYTKLAVNNLKRNKNVYFPFLVASTSIIFTYFIFISISMNKGMESLPDGQMLQNIFLIGEWGISIFSLIFIFYANSFLMKRRIKEIGLYGILGLEKKHICFIILFETLLLCAISIIIAVIIGMVFSKLFFLILLRILHVKGINTFDISIQAISQTIMFFLGVFFLTFIFNFIKVRNTSSITLLKEESKGEKEPKTPIVITVLGLVTLGFGYGIVLIVNSSEVALGSFLIGVILVTYGTYSLFTSGSITLLKLMKKNKKIFYKPNNFISVSNMIYRMKKNAVGLANICLLSTIIIVIISTTFSLYLGKDNMLKNKNQFDLAITCTDSNVGLLDMTENLAIKNHVSLKEIYQYNAANFTGYIKNNTLGTAETVAKEEQHDCNYEVTLLQLDDFNKITNSQKTLDRNQILLYFLNGNYNSDILSFANGKNTIEYSIKEELENFILQDKQDSRNIRKMFIIVKDIEQIKNIQTVMNFGSLQFSTNLNLEGAESDKLNFAEKLQRIANQKYNITTFSSIDIDGADWYSIFGGLLFLGVFLGFLIIIALVLIIYFKQISEGYEDKKRFNILQKVGMSKEEVKKTINKQIKLVFFLPLLGAVIHVSVAYKIICNMLAAFRLTNTTLIFICMFSVAAVFSLIYITVYYMTSKVYYKLINMS